MIISASRRTDLPALYAEWLARRFRDEFCTVPNPRNRKQIGRVSLKPQDVDAIVFWTRNPRPLMAYLDEFDARGYPYYFQYTVLGYPRQVDPRSPSLRVAVRTFRELSDRIGPDRVIWRDDPIVFSALTTSDFHRDNFQRLAESLCGFTMRSVISLVDTYRKTEKRMQQLEEIAAGPPQEAIVLIDLLPEMAAVARANGIEIVSCAEPIDLQPYGIHPGKCVDDKLIAQVFGVETERKKDPAQREACGCVVSRDIGVYESCVLGCRYCYATADFAQAQRHRQQHDPLSSSLLE